MRYFLYWEDSLGRAISELLKGELSRFDVRAEFVESVGLKKDNDADVMIFVTSRRKKSSNVLPTFTLHITSKKNRSYSASSPGNQTVYLDLPTSNSQGVEYLGCPLFDVFKKLEVTADTGSNEASVPLIAGYNAKEKRSSITKLKSRLAVRHPKVHFTTTNVETELESLASMLQNANATIVTSWVGELAALYFNVPYVFYQQKKIFGTAVASFQNGLSNQGSIVCECRSISSVSVELDRILNDHQYTAGMLQKFQETKEIIGNQPSIRSIARDIVERTEG